MLNVSYDSVLFRMFSFGEGGGAGERRVMY